MVSPSRRQFLSAMALGAVSGCLGQGGGGSAPQTSGNPDQDGTTGGDTSGGGTSQDSPTSGRSPSPARPSGPPTASGRLPLSMSPEQIRENARSGGPPKDGIPSIDQPQFVSAGEAGFLDPDDPVFGVVRDGTAKAYPQQILVHHEIVNDTLAGTNVAVTYCPLTGTVQGFERGETTFGVSGRLINSNLVMYDRASETWWPQILATSIPGPWNEDPEIHSLQEFRLIWTTWKRWTAHNPDTRVLSTGTGFARNYRNDPYGSYNPRGGYYKKDDLLFSKLHSDERYRNKTVVMGARTPDGAVAFKKRALRKKKLLTGEVGGDPVVAVYDPRFNTAYTYRNPDQRSYEFDDGVVTGPDGTTHSPDALPLSRIHTFDAMWFAWYGYYPDTNVYE